MTERTNEELADALVKIHRHLDNEGCGKSTCQVVVEAVARLRGQDGEPHTSWCRSNELALCSGCSVRKGWDRNGVTGEHTTCNGGAPHEWRPLPCNCGPNDRRRGDRRTLILHNPKESGE